MSGFEFPSSVRIVEAGLRDGLQAVSSPILSTMQKVDVVQRLIESGVRHIEAVSFAHPRVLPQLADAEALMAQVPRSAEVVYRGLIPNLHGAKRAASTGLDEWVLVVSADSEVSERNQNRTTAQMIEEMAPIAELAEDAQARLVVTIACALFAPARGAMPRERTLTVLQAAVDLGVKRICLAGTTGQEVPTEVYELLSDVGAEWPDVEFGFHLHNRNGFAPANALAAISAGATWLETSFLGIGGDMWFPGAPEVLGNAPTEDIVHLLDAIGVETGIDLERYLDVVAHVEEQLGQDSYSFVTRGGTREALARATWPVR